MDTNAPAPKPDMLEHAGKLLKRLNGMSYVSDNLVADNENTVALASAVLAVAAELRDIHNVLHEINQLLAAADDRDALAKSAAIWGTGS